jgi:hypothetical protein
VCPRHCRRSLHQASRHHFPLHRTSLRRQPRSPRPLRWRSRLRCRASSRAGVHRHTCQRPISQICRRLLPRASRVWQEPDLRAVAARDRPRALR